MKAAIFSTFLFLLNASCVTSKEDLAQKLSSWHGSKIEEVKEVYGEPTTINKNNEQKTKLTYQLKSEVVAAEVSQPSTGSRIKRTGGRKNEIVICNISFDVSASNKIENSKLIDGEYDHCEQLIKANPKVSVD